MCWYLWSLSQTNITSSAIIFSLIDCSAQTNSDLVMKNNSVLWCEIISFTLSTTAWLQVYQKQDVFHFYNRHILVFSFLKGGFFCKLEASKISGVNGLLKENINNLSLHLSKILYRFAVFILKWNRNSTFSYETLTVRIEWVKYVLTYHTTLDVKCWK